MRKLLFFAAFVCFVTGLALAGTDSGSISPPVSQSVFFGYDATGDDSLTTLFASNNNFAGNSFDIVTTNAITIVGFDVNLDLGLTHYTIDVWTREGTADGFEMTAAGWTLLGSEYVAAAGVDLKTHVDIGGLYIATAETVGVIITAQEAVSGTGGFCYTNGGPNTYSNSDISITTYRGLPAGFPPASVYTYRAWNGTVHYLYGTALTRNTWGNIKAGF